MMSARNREDAGEQRDDELIYNDNFASGEHEYDHGHHDNDNYHSEGPHTTRKTNNTTPSGYNLDHDEAGGASLLEEDDEQHGGRTHGNHPYQDNLSDLAALSDDGYGDEIDGVGRAETTAGDLSIPAEQRKYLMEMDKEQESSFGISGLQEVEDPEDYEHHVEEHQGFEQYHEGGHRRGEQKESRYEHQGKEAQPARLQSQQSQQPPQQTNQTIDDQSRPEDEFEDFDSFSMIQPEQTPSLRSRKSLMKNLLSAEKVREEAKAATPNAANKSTNSSSSRTTTNNDNNATTTTTITTSRTVVSDMGPPPLPPLHRINSSRSSQRRLERSRTAVSGATSAYSQVPSASSIVSSRLGSKARPRGKIPVPPSEEPLMAVVLSSEPDAEGFIEADDSFDISSPPLPQHMPSSDNEDQAFAPSSPIVQAQFRRQGREVQQQQQRSKLQRSGSNKSVSGTKRPKFLRSRHSSTRSSISSVHSAAGGGYHSRYDDEYEGTDGASTVHVTQAGVTQAQSGELEQEKEISGGGLSRSTSLGSIASGITGLGTSVAADTSGNPIKVDRRRGLDPLTEVRSGLDEGRDEEDSDDEPNPPLPPETTLGDDQDEDDNDGIEPAKIPLPRGTTPEQQPMTPKNSKPPMPHPTMTAVNTQVNQIQIPPTVAREIRSKHAFPPSTRKYNPAASGKNMTLKEQSAIIDKLQKENFDLKIKVYYLSERLEKTSEEGVAEVNKENLELKVKLAELRKEIRNLRKQLREARAEAGKGGSTDGEDDGEAGDRRKDRETEIIELKEKIERYEIEISRLRRKMASEGGAEGNNAGSDVEILKDLLENESLRREQAEMENQRLRDEIWRLQQGGASGSQQPGPSSLHPPFHNMARRPSATSHSDGSNTGPSRPNQQMDQATLLARLRAENEELKRDLGAQTSMLTSRNRERDGLYAQIEELKLSMRSGGPIGSAGGSDHLGPRFQHLHHGSTERSMSRDSFGHSSTTAVLTEAEREDMENLNGILRDRISELKLRNQELELQLESAIRELEEADRLKVEMERAQAEYEEEIDILTNEIHELQLEREHVLRSHEEVLQDFTDLKAEAEEELEKVDAENLELKEMIPQLELACQQKDEDFEALQGEMRNLTSHVVALEDVQAHRQRVIEELTAEKQALEQEIEVLEKKVREEEQKVERLNVQLESAQGEITFLREEQDADKIKIGVLENQVKKGEEAVREEKERVRDWERRFAEDKRRLERDGGRSGGRESDVERRLAERNQELQQREEENQKLRNSVRRREQEAQEWRGRLEEVEGALREALGDVTGTKTGLLESIGSLQRELEQTLEELDSTKRKLGDRERTLQDREDLLESMAIENKKLTEILEKEKAARRAEKAQLESAQASQYQSRRALSQHQTQINELQQTRNRESKTLHQLEQQLRDQLADRNGLLTSLWTRLSAICGPEWSHRNSLVSTNSAVGAAGAGSPAVGKLSMEAAVLNAFPAFSKNLMSAVKAIEAIVSGFKTRCKSVERDLWKEYQVVESALESRTRRLERLEALVRAQQGEAGNAARTEAARAEIEKLKSENRTLRKEIERLKNAMAAQVEAAKAAQQPATASKSTEKLNTNSNNAGNGTHLKETVTSTAHHTTEPRSAASRAREIYNSLTRSSGSQAAAELSAANANAPQSPKSSSSNQQHQTTTQTTTETETTTAASEKRWILRLRELEKRLKAEREARLLDRSGAKKRLEEAKGEKEELRAELERERERLRGVSSANSLVVASPDLTLVGGGAAATGGSLGRSSGRSTSGQHYQQQAGSLGRASGSGVQQDVREKLSIENAKHDPTTSSSPPHQQKYDPNPPIATSSTMTTTTTTTTKSSKVRTKSRHRGEDEGRDRDREGKETKSTSSGRGVSRHRGGEREETKEERRERKERERMERGERKETKEERRERKERERERERHGMEGLGLS